MIYTSLISAYVKKEDVLHYVGVSRRISAYALLIVAGLVDFIFYTVYPKLASLYSDFVMEPPLSVVYIPYIILLINVICIGYALVLIFSNSYKPTLQNELISIKEGEMVNVRKYSVGVYVFIVPVVMAFVVGFLIISLIMPIYSLTSKF